MKKHRVWLILFFIHSSMNPMNVDVFPLERLSKEIRNHIASFLRFSNEESREEFMKRLIAKDRVRKRNSLLHENAHKQKCVTFNRLQLSKEIGDQKQSIFKRCLVSYCSTTIINYFSFSQNMMHVVMETSELHPNLYILNTKTSKWVKLPAMDLHNLQSIACSSNGTYVACNDYNENKQINEIKILKLINSNCYEHFFSHKTQLSFGSDVEFNKAGNMLGFVHDPYSQDSDTELFVLPEKEPIKTLDRYFREKGICKAFEKIK